MAGASGYRRRRRDGARDAVSARRGPRSEATSGGPRCADAALHVVQPRPRTWSGYCRAGRIWRWCSCRCSTICARCEEQPAAFLEGTVAAAQSLKSDEPAQPLAQAGDVSISVAQWARRLRPRFQVGLLGYYPRRADRAESVRCSSKVAEKLEQVATTQPVFQLWWVIGALLEAVRHQRQATAARRQDSALLGQADRQLKAAL